MDARRVADAITAESDARLAVGSGAGGADNIIGNRFGGGAIAG
jgi:hypothetical protein